MSLAPTSLTLDPILLWIKALLLHEIIEINAVARIIQIVKAISVWYGHLGLAASSNGLKYPTVEETEVVVVSKSVAEL